MPAADRLWRAATNRLAREASARVVATWVAHEAGRMAYDEAVQVMATIIATGQRRAVTMNDVLLARELGAQLASSVQPVGLTWRESVEDQSARLTKAVSTTLGTDIEYVANAPKSEQAALMRESVATRLTRLSEGETWGASQWSRQESAVQQAPSTGIVGYTRVLNPGACELCVTIGGAQPERNVRPLHHRFATHPTGSCKCSMRFVSEVRPDDRWLGSYSSRPPQVEAAS